MGRTTKNNFSKSFMILGLALVLGLSTAAYSQKLDHPQTREERQTGLLKEEVRHQLVMMPYFSVFDWLEAQVAPWVIVTNGKLWRNSADVEERSRSPYQAVGIGDLSREQD